MNNLPTGTVIITGTTTQGQILSVSHNLVDVDGLGAISYQWKADDIKIGEGKETYTLTEDEVEKTITVVASYTDQLGTDEIITSDPTAAIVNVNDSPTGNFRIIGNTRQGETLAIHNTLKDKDGLGTMHYQWKTGEKLLSETDHYFITSSVLGEKITVTVEYTDQHGTLETKTSRATNRITEANLLPIGTVFITGTLKDGQRLTVEHNLADKNGLGEISYEWKADTISIGEGDSYLLTPKEVGKKITVTALYVDQLGTAESLSSVETIAIATRNTLPTGRVTITGTAELGNILTANNTLEDEDGLGTLIYRWKAGIKTLGKDETYKITDAEIGKHITVTISYTDKQGSIEGRTSSATLIVPDPNAKEDPKTNLPVPIIVDDHKHINTAVYNDDITNYTLTKAVTGFKITHNSSQLETVLTTVARLKFNDKMIALDIDGHAGQAYRIYQAALNRAPDKEGLGNWINKLDEGASINEVAKLFINSPEFITTYGAHSNDETFITLLYFNVLHREPDAEGLNGWLSYLQSHTKAGTLASFSESSENKTNVLPQISTGIEYQPVNTQFNLADDNIFISLITDDNYEGGDGRDTIIYSQTQENYLINRITTSFNVISTDEGNDTLVNIERLQFTDSFVALDIDGNAGQAYRLYQAAFNHAPDKKGLGFWINALDNNKSLTTAATAFIDSQEFSDLYGKNTDDSNFIAHLFNNVLAREADSNGEKFWLNKLQTESRAEVLIGFSESAENKLQVIGDFQHGIDYTEWL